MEKARSGGDPDEEQAAEDGPVQDEREENPAGQASWTFDLRRHGFPPGPLHSHVGPILAYFGLSDGRALRYHVLLTLYASKIQARTEFFARSIGDYADCGCAWRCFGADCR